jgi:CPA2 family monovalent cation:H+ antiporter-2
LSEPGFTSDLAIVLGIAAVTNAVAQKLRIPVVLSYLAAGLIVGPNVPIPISANHQRVEILAEFGIIFVMFCVGLEFRLKKLIEILPTGGVTALLQIFTMYTVGYYLGLLFGWTNVEAIFLGSSVCISSTMIVSKVLEQNKSSETISEHVYGVLIIQDITAIVILALLTAVASGSNPSAQGLVFEAGKLSLFILTVLAGGLLTIPRFIRYLIRTKSVEGVVIAACGICFSLAMIAQHYGYSVALGAFFGGMLVSESGHGHAISVHLTSMKNVFAAIFFVAVGMSVDPVSAWENLPYTLAITASVITAQFLSVFAAGLLSGISFNKAISAGLALGQIGEFAFIIASMGVAAKVISVPLLPILVTVAVITAFTTPLLFSRADKIISRIDRLVPKKIRAILALYESRFEAVRSIVHKGKELSLIRKIRNAVALDFGAIIGLSIIFGNGGPFIVESLRFAEISDGKLASILQIIYLGLVSTLYLALYRNLLMLKRVFLSSRYLSIKGIGSHSGMAFILTIIVFGFAAIPPLLVIGSFNGFYYGLAAALTILAISAFAIYRQAGAIDYTIKSSAQSAVQYVDQKIFSDPSDADNTRQISMAPNELLNVKIEKDSNAIGKNLAAMNLRAKTGATVIAIIRKDGETILPTGSEIIKESDILCIAGTRGATHDAIELVEGVVL